MEFNNKNNIKDENQVLIYSLFFAGVLTLIFAFFSLFFYFSFFNFIFKISIFFIIWFLLIFLLFSWGSKNNINEKADKEIRDNLIKKQNIEDEMLGGMLDETDDEHSEEPENIEEELFDLNDTKENIFDEKFNQDLSQKNIMIDKNFKKDKTIDLSNNKRRGIMEKGINTQDENLKKEVELEKIKKKAIEKKEVTAKLISKLLKSENTSL